MTSRFLLETCSRCESINRDASGVFLLLRFVYFHRLISPKSFSSRFCTDFVLEKFNSRERWNPALRLTTAKKRKNRGWRSERGEIPLVNYNEPTRVLLGSARRA